MIYDVFSVFDDKAAAFLPPFILQNQNMAKRIFADCVNSEDHQFGRNPADYTLFRLGQFDDSAGQFLLERTKHSLGNGVEFRSLDRPRSPELGNGKAQADESVPQIGDVAPVRSDPASEHSQE